MLRLRAGDSGPAPGRRAMCDEPKGPAGDGSGASHSTHSRRPSCQGPSGADAIAATGVAAMNDSGVSEFP